MKNVFNILSTIGMIIFWTGFAISVRAQGFSIRGMVNNYWGEPIPFANVLLLRAADSVQSQGIFTDSLGIYIFQQVQEGKYFLRLSISGMEAADIKAFEVSGQIREIDLGALSLKYSDKALNQVTITGRKPFIEQKLDRTVINVRNSISSAGGSALEVLEKSPGVTVNRQSGNIALNGKNGVNVMLNGKMTYMPEDALVQLLSGIPAGNIEKIELITTPPSKLDAGGNGGYINIVFINNPYAGFNGNWFLTAGFGDRPLASAGFNFNYRSSKINFFGDYSFNYEHTLQPTTAVSHYINKGNLVENNTWSDRDAVRTIQNARLGADYQLNESTIVGVLVSGYISRWSMFASNGALISRNHIPDTTILSTDDPEINLWRNLSANLNVQHIFKPGRILYFDANYIYYKDNNPNTYATDYYNYAKDLLYHQDLKGEKTTPIHITVLSSDYTTPLGKKINLESGLKLSLSDFTNDVGVTDMTGNVSVPDTSLSAKYILNENITAVYSSCTFNLDSKTTITAGLRYEYTMSDLSAVKMPKIVNRKYGNLFPTFFLSKKIDESNTIQFSYNRRITRPAFTDLAPFTIFFDPKTYYSGNPGLIPAIADALQLGYNFKSYHLALIYTYEKNTIDNFYFQVRTLDTANNIVYLSARNFTNQQYGTVAFSIPVTVSKRWSMQNNLNGNWREINTAFDEKPVNLRYFDFSFNTIQRFNFPHDISLELIAMYSSVSYVGTAKRQPMYQLGGGIQKKLTGGRDLIRFAANDVLNSGSNYQFAENLPFAEAYVGRNFNFRLASYKLTYTHSFGNHALKEKRSRSTSAEEELNRVKN